MFGLNKYFQIIIVILVKKGWCKMDIQGLFDKVKEELNNSSDLYSHIFEKSGVQIGVICLKSMTDDKLFYDGVCRPIENFDGKISHEVLSSKIIGVKEFNKIDEKEIAEKVINGFAILVTSDSDQILGVDILSYPTRVPAEPPTSQVIQGPREGFVEDIRTNIALLRRRFYNKDFVVKQISIGEQTQTKVAVAYLKTIANQKIVKRILKKLNEIEIDGIIDAYYIVKKMEEHPYSMFKQIGSQEKPDIVASKLLEGKVAIIVDGSPIVLTIPYVLLEDFQNSNDYYTNSTYATLIRLVRLVGVFIAIIVPGTYLALRLFHFNVIPVNYLITIANTTMALPFTPFIELFFINLLFQILYEVSLRLPSYLGLATSIVGALILGDTGVKAGLISPPGVIIIALSKIAVYTVPEVASQLTILQLVFLVIGGSVGLLGIIGGMIYLINYLNTIDSFGTPYLAPYSPKITADLKDGLFKSQLNEMKTRPLSFGNKTNKKRQK